MSEGSTTDLAIGSLRQAYQTGARTPTEVVETHIERVRAGPSEAWISRVPVDRLRERAETLQSEAASDGINWEETPLYGMLFALKDNIDHAGMPTTAACPAFEYVPDDHATVVERLLDAGAIFVGKTNLDQFATGLVGTRSPYGETPNAIDPAYISGGSSAGSGVAVALGQVSFALGTDTAGSGRVPAALNGVVGLKPSRGVLSNDGVVPACKSLDCVAVFATTVRDALTVERVTAGFDPVEEYSRRRADDLVLKPSPMPSDLTVGVPRESQLEFFGDDAAAECFAATVSWLDERFDTRRLDIEPFVRAGQLLYQGPWVAERLAAIQGLLTEHPDALLPVTRRIITRGREFDAADAYNAEYKLRRLARTAHERLSTVDVLLTPTTGTTYTRADVAERPVETNSNLGHYTNFVNLLDLAAVAVPAGRRPSGLPFGVTFFADSFTDATLATIADTYCHERDVSLGASGDSYADVPTPTQPTHSK